MKLPANAEPFQSITHEPVLACAHVQAWCVLSCFLALAFAHIHPFLAACVFFLAGVGGLRLKRAALYSLSFVIIMTPHKSRRIGSRREGVWFFCAFALGSDFSYPSIPTSPTSMGGNLGTLFSVGVRSQGEPRISLLMFKIQACNLASKVL
jgi:hypothetical protein